MNEFEKWFEQKYGSTFQTCKNPALYKSLEAAFLAGAAAMRERCAEVTEKMTRECPSDQCPQYSDADDCMYKDTGYCIANAIRRLKI